MREAMTLYSCLRKLCERTSMKLDTLVMMLFCVACLIVGFYDNNLGIDNERRSIKFKILYGGGLQKA